MEDRIGEETKRKKTCRACGGKSRLGFLAMADAPSYFDWDTEFRVVIPIKA